MADNIYKQHYLYPATLFASREPHIINTILGSCVAVCMWDSVLGYGGINHYMLPLWNGKGLASPKYGNIAIKKLYERMIDLGCSSINLRAKMFGGADILQSTAYQFNIGQRNIEIAREYLDELAIPLTGMSVGGSNGRKILFDSYKGTVVQKYIEKTNI